MLEKQLNDRVGYRCRKHRVRVLRIQRAAAGGAGFITPAAKGFPDLLVVTAGRIMYRELKRELGRLSPEQEDWRDAIRRAGGDWDVWRPSDLRSGRIEAEIMGTEVLRTAGTILSE